MVQDYAYYCLNTTNPGTAVMNLTEMEAKVCHVTHHQDPVSDTVQVREATNGDPWGASATLMQEISQGTHN
jgi:epsin